MAMLPRQWLKHRQSISSKIFSQNKILFHSFSTISQDSDIYDVVVIGAGIPGSAATCGIANIPNTKVALLDIRTPPNLDTISQPSDIDIRVFAITPSSRRFLQELEVWDTIQECRAQPYTNMQVWDASSPGCVRFTEGSTHTGALGHIVENRVLSAALQSRVEKLQQESEGSLTTIFGERIKSIELPPERQDRKLDTLYKHTTTELSTNKLEPDDFGRIQLEDGRVLQARLIVGADGAQSFVRQSANIGYASYDYEQRGVVATIRTTGHEDTAWQRFLPHGPLAILPLWDDYASIVWSTTPQHAQWLQKECTSEEFIASLNRALTIAPEYRGESPLYDILHDISIRSTSFLNNAASNILQDKSFAPKAAPHVVELVGKRASFPLRGALAYRHTQSRLALIGDAAHTIHPLGGQGLNLGLGDAECLTSVLQSASTIGADWGSTTILREYEQDRIKANTSVLVAMDTINSLFTDEEPSSTLLSATPFKQIQTYGLRATRGIGMTLFNAFSPLKSAAVQYAANASATGNFKSLFRSMFMGMHSNRTTSSDVHDAWGSSGKQWTNLHRYNHPRTTRTTATTTTTDVSPNFKPSQSSFQATESMDPIKNVPIQ